MLFAIVIVSGGLIRESEGQEQFFTDFLWRFKIGDPLFISAEDVDQDLQNSSINSKAAALIRYKSYQDEEEVAKHLENLYYSGDLTTVVFIDDGHTTLLQILMNVLKLMSPKFK